MHAGIALLQRALQPAERIVRIGAGGVDQRDLVGGGIGDGVTGERCVQCAFGLTAATECVERQRRPDQLEVGTRILLQLEFGECFYRALLGEPHQSQPVMDRACAGEAPLRLHEDARSLLETSGAVVGVTELAVVVVVEGIGVAGLQVQRDRSRWRRACLPLRLTAQTCKLARQSFRRRATRGALAGVTGERFTHA